MIFSPLRGLNKIEEPASGFRIMLNSAGLIPEQVGGITFAGVDWNVSGACTWVLNQGHPIQKSGGNERLRLEIHNNNLNNDDDDREYKRRVGINASEQKFTRGVGYWGALSFLHESWSDPEGMDDPDLSGGLFIQMHSGPEGGSPAIAFRRFRDGDLMITYTYWEVDPLFTSRSIASLTRSGETVTVTTSVAHGFDAGDRVAIAGATPSGYNGTWQMLTASGSTFTFNCEDDTLTTPASGTMTATVVKANTNNKIYKDNGIDPDTSASINTPRSQTPWDAGNDLVYYFEQHETTGVLKLWLNGDLIVDEDPLPLGASGGGTYLGVNAYFAEGITCPVVNQFANFVFPFSGGLAGSALPDSNSDGVPDRVSSPPAWPSDTLVTTGAPETVARVQSGTSVSATTFTPDLSAYTTGQGLVVHLTFNGQAGETVSTRSLGWTKLIDLVDDSGTIGGAVFFYGEGVTLAAATSSSSIPALVIDCTGSRQYSALCHTVTLPQTTSIECEVASREGQNHQAPWLTPLWADPTKASLWWPSLHIDSDKIIHAGPPGYVKFWRKQGLTTSGGVGIAEHRAKLLTEGPGRWKHTSEQGVAITTALSAYINTWHTSTAAFLQMLAALGITPSSARQTRINNFIGGMDTAGIWDEIDLFYVLAAHTAEGAKLNWKRPREFTLTPVESVATPGQFPTFTANEGYACNGVDNYLDTGWNANGNAVKFAQNAATLGVWLFDAPAASGNLWGSRSSAGNPSSINPRASGPNFGHRVNNATNVTIANDFNGGSVATSGLFTATRTGSGTTRVYYNGVDEGGGTQASGTPLSSSNWSLGAAAGGFSAHEAAMAFNAGLLDATRQADLYTLAAAYMSGLASD
jgi:hypothetical protein